MNSNPFAGMVVENSATKAMSELGDAIAKCFAKVFDACKAMGETMISLLSRDMVSLELETAIRSSKAMLSLHQDWDHEGAIAIEHPTWENMQTLLRTWDLDARGRAYVGIQIPEISPLPDGRIELTWNWGNRFLVVDAPVGGKGKPTFYARRGDNELLGTLAQDATIETLIPWIGLPRAG